MHTTDFKVIELFQKHDKVGDVVQWAVSAHFVTGLNILHFNYRSFDLLGNAAPLRVTLPPDRVVLDRLPEVNAMALAVQRTEVFAADIQQAVDAWLSQGGVVPDRLKPGPRVDVQARVQEAQPEFAEARSLASGGGHGTPPAEGDRTGKEEATRAPKASPVAAPLATPSDAPAETPPRAEAPRLDYDPDPDGVRGHGGYNWPQ